MVRALILIFSASCALSLFVNWAARNLARRVGLVDRPDGHRKLQRQAIPLAGGIAIFVVILAIIGSLIAFDPGWRSIVFAHGNLSFGLIAAGTLIVIVGYLDDSMGLRGRQKLAGQLAAAGVIVAFGLCIKQVQVLEWNIELGIFSIPFTVFWLVGAMNALNLLDGVDGLAGIIGVILSGAIAVLALLTGHETIALVATVLTGSLIGFLRFNLPPASMYLGDAGSMLIGLAIGVMAVQASLKGTGTVLMAVPLVLWTIPIFDSCAAVLRRKLTGRSIYATDRGHLHHHLVERFGHRMTLVWVATVSLLTSIAALLSVWWKHDLIAILCAGIVIALFVSLRIFGHSELMLALVRARSLFRSIFLPQPSNKETGWDDAVRLQGSRQWGVMWETLTECAIRLELVELRLDVNVPILGEGYYATWSRSNGRDGDHYWRLDMPLMAERRLLGFVRVVGERGNVAAHNLEQLMDLLGQVESHLHRLVHSEPTVSHREAVVPIPHLGAREAVLEHH